MSAPHPAGRLAEHRRVAHLTQRELAHLAHVSPSVVWRAELGNSVPTRESISRLALALGVTPEALADPADPHDRLARRDGAEDGR